MTTASPPGTSAPTEKVVLDLSSRYTLEKAINTVETTSKQHIKEAQIKHVRKRKGSSGVFRKLGGFSLERLHVSQTGRSGRICRISFHDIAAAVGPCLESIEISQLHFYCRGVDSLVNALRGHRSLTRIKLEGCGMVNIMPSECLTPLIRVLATLPNLESCHFSNSGVVENNPVRAAPLLSDGEMVDLFQAFAVSNSLQTLSIAGCGRGPTVSGIGAANALANLLTVNHCLQKLEVTVEAGVLASAILDPLTFGNRTLQHLQVDMVNATKDDHLLIPKLLERMMRQNDVLMDFHICHAKLSPFTGNYKKRIRKKGWRTDIVQHCLELNRAGRRQLSSGNATAQDWNRCLEEHKDNTNVVFGLLSMDPTLWLNFCRDYLRRIGHPAPSPQALTMGCSTPGCFCCSFSPGW